MMFTYLIHESEADYEIWAMTDAKARAVNPPKGKLWGRTIPMTKEETDRMRDFIAKREYDLMLDDMMKPQERTERGPRYTKEATE